MTKRTRSSELVRARKETKRLQREANTRIRKAIKEAKRSGDEIELQNVMKAKKTFSNSLTTVKKTGLPKSYTRNVNWEKGRALDLKKLVNRSILSKKKKQKISRKTFEKLFGEKKTKEYLSKIGGSEVRKLSNQFWEQLYKAQDMLFAAGIVPADEIMGRWGSIGSGLLNTGKQLVNDGYWETIVFELGDTETNGSKTSTDIIAHKDEKKITTGELAEAIVQWYMEKYGLN